MIFTAEHRPRAQQTAVICLRSRTPFPHVQTSSERQIKSAVQNPNKRHPSSALAPRKSGAALEPAS